MGISDRRKLPIGIQTFCKIREENCYYVDKTAHIRRLIDEGSHYFLSRPRRFGKSLFLDTLKELFEGLYIHDHWDWQVRYPVLRLDFGSGNFNEPESLHKEVMAQLDAVEKETGVESHYDTPTAGSAPATTCESNTTSTAAHPSKNNSSASATQAAAATPPPLPKMHPSKPGSKNTGSAVNNKKQADIYRPV